MSILIKSNNVYAASRINELAHTTTQKTAYMSQNDHAEFNVGGLSYTVAVADIQKHPHCVLGTLLRLKWKPGGPPINIDRDGAPFKYVFAFLMNGHLPRGADGTIAADVLHQLREEADFYNLPALSDECNTTSAPNDAPSVVPNDIFAKIATYSTIRSYISTVKDALQHASLHPGIPQLDCSYASSNPLDLVNVLACVWRPYCARGEISRSTVDTLPLLGSSTIAFPNVPDLLDAAQQSSFGRGTETILDTSVRNSWEIPASQLIGETLAMIAKSIELGKFAPKMTLQLRPYKLVIYQQGGHFDQHRDTVRGDNHIGTLVVILNSMYMGGELEISHGGKTEVVTGPYSWVAMYGDCLHKINPVTFGTRVSLIYDIYAVASIAPDGDGSVESEEFVFGSGNGSDSNSDGGSDSDVSFDDESDGACAEQEALSEFVSNRRRAGDIAVDSILEVGEHQQKRIFNALDRDLASNHAVVICLAHMYPSCQSNPSFLKGGDMALYELLRDRYVVSVEPVSVYTQRDCEEGSAAMRAALLKDVDNEATQAAAQGNNDGPATKKARVGASARKKVKFVIPTILNADSVLDYSPYNEYTGNERQAEELVYIVAGLQVEWQRPSILLC